MSQPTDIARAHAAVDAWAQATNIQAHLPQVDGCSIWWRLRFLLIHEHIPQLLAPPQSVSVRAPSVQVRVSRIFKALIGELRLRGLLRARPVRPRVLVISRANAWDGTRDRELWSAIETLEQGRVETLVMEQSHGPLAGQLQGWRTRPRTHLLGDFIHLRYKLGKRPDFAQTHLPRIPLLLDGKDLGSQVADYIEKHASHHAHEHQAYLTVMPDILRRLSVRAVLLADENGGEQGMKMAALAAGIPVVAVQHGCIHADHMNYIFPAGSPPQDIPLATRTCVYGEHERSLLTTQSCYAPDSIVVTGQVANDARVLTHKPWTEKSPQGQALRIRTLPPNCDRLLLLTSQDLLHEIAAERLLPKLRDSAPRNFLVVRPHPREKGDHWTHHFLQHGVTDRAIVAREGTLEEWLDACDAHVSVSSTVLSEAVVYGRPNLVVGHDRVGDWLGVIEGNMAVDLDTTTLDAAIETWQARSPEEIQTNRTHYITQHFHQLDGKAGQRIAETTLQQMTMDN
jgi:hypothetical protein